MLIRPARDMNDEDFLQHLNLRHVPCDDFAGMVRLSDQAMRDRSAFQAYHAYMHERYEYQHAHSS